MLSAVLLSISLYLLLCSYPSAFIILFVHVHPLLFLHCMWLHRVAWFQASCLGQKLCWLVLLENDQKKYHILASWQPLFCFCFQMKAKMIGALLSFKVSNYPCLSSVWHHRMYHCTMYFSFHLTSFGRIIIPTFHAILQSCLYSLFDVLPISTIGMYHWTWKFFTRPKEVHLLSAIIRIITYVIVGRFCTGHREQNC